MLRNKKTLSENRMVIRQMLLFTILLLVALSGCSSEKNGEKEDKETCLYYVSADNTRIEGIPFPAPVVEEDPFKETEYYEALTYAWIDALSGVPSDVTLKSPIDKGLEINSVVYVSGVLTIDFGESYLSAESPIAEVMRRAAIVQTLLQMDGVEGIAFTVNGNPITDSKLLPIGIMTADTFVRNPGAEINSYETTVIQLYFADEEGVMLIGTKERVGYISNISMERLIVERIIAGPLTDAAYPVVSPTVKVINVTTKDGICYVNLDNSFLTKSVKASDEDVLYAFVNSLTELPNVSKVQFMIDSESEVTFGDHLYLSEPFERNLELISVKE